MLPSPVDELERLEALNELGILDTPPEERFDRVTRLCQRLFGVPMAFINLIDRDRQWAKSAQGGALPEVPRSTSVCSNAMTMPGGLVVEDLSADPRFRDFDTVAGDPHIRFYAGVPLTARGGQPVGALCIVDTAPRQLSDADRNLLADLALWVEKELNLEEEFDRAAEVQAALFPARPPQDPHWDVAGVCRPSRQVGGDFYDWHGTPFGTVISLGDVMGKGMSAAIVMASVRAALRAGARRPDLAGALAFTAASLADDLESTGTFATLVTARLGDRGQLACVDAGHGHAAVIRATGHPEEIRQRGFPLGIDIGERYVLERHVLGPDDLFVAWSDGLPDAGGPGTAEEVARAVRCAPTAEEAVDRLLDTLGPGSPPDDVTILAARRRA
jgi:hypothetical protein